MSLTKKTIAALGCLLLICLNIKAQNEKPEFLKEPVSWSFERFPLPPTFSATFPYKGVEELRFSPGMFKKDSSDYFSYAFVARLDNTSAVTQAEVTHYLLMYFKGLCNAVAGQRHLSIDTSKITVSMEGIAHSNPTIYNAVLKIFGVFADGAPVSLNAEIKVLSDPKAQTSFLVFIASPQGKTHSIWRQLYMIRNGFLPNGNYY